MIETTADRLALINDAPDLALFAKVPDAFDEDGEAVVIVQRNVAGLFDRAYININGHEGFHPIFLCVDEDVQYLKQHHRLMVKGQVWRIDEQQPDGTGFTQLRLKLLGPYRIGTSIAHGGFPYVLPAVLGGGTSLYSSATVDPDNPRLRYPYTISTYLDYSAHTVSL